MMRSGSKYLVVGIAWLLLALLAGASGVVASMRPPLPQVVLAALTVMLVVAYLRATGLRAWLDTLDIRAILALHLARFVGAWFLVLYGRGELPYAFAVPGGWGDIVSATGAALLMFLVQDFASRRWLIAGWNVWGMLDILMVVLTAARLFLADPPSMHALLVLPLSLLPTFLVPLIIASHLLVFRRLAMAASREPSRASV
jgi:hypothetical protein